MLSPLTMAHAMPAFATSADRSPTGCSLLYFWCILLSFPPSPATSQHTFLYNASSIFNSCQSLQKWLWRAHVLVLVISGVFGNPFNTFLLLVYYFLSSLELYLLSRALCVAVDKVCKSPPPPVHPILEIMLFARLFSP